MDKCVHFSHNRYGGRTWSRELKTPNGTMRWDMGALTTTDAIKNASSGGQWVGKTQPHVLGLLSELNIGTYEQYVGGSSNPDVGLISGADFLQIAARIEDNAAKVRR